MKIYEIQSNREHQFLSPAGELHLIQNGTRAMVHAEILENPTQLPENPVDNGIARTAETVSRESWRACVRVWVWGEKGLCQLLDWKGPNCVEDRRILTGSFCRPYRSEDLKPQWPRDFPAVPFLAACGHYKLPSRPTPSSLNN